MRSTPLLSLLLVLLLTTPAAACSGHSGSSTCCLPGFGLTGFHVGFVLAIFAGFLERPLLSRAGVGEGALAYAIQANFISSLVTGVTGFVVISMDSPAGNELVLLWMPLSLLVAASIEHGYLLWRRAQSSDKPLRFGWILLANVISAAVIFVMPFFRSVFGTDTYRYIRWIQPHQPLIAVLTLTACGLVLILACAISPRRPLASSDRHGFEVIGVAMRTRRV